ncbi:DUF2294 domain-containing protein [Paenibacillus sp. IHB B 3084]|uniref:DUF2294 domain-containing protein n=1 Tax=Paenibacillus sp. IHB B 3084 TaxID=867076 RepID=UPI001CB92A95|nr:DUF2294 domain-containing protein [Paenibacillus sp. IHB B 3084]
MLGRPSWAGRVRSAANQLHRLSGMCGKHAFILIRSGVVQMLNTEWEYRERIRKLAVCIVKHYRGKGPDNVKVSLESPLRITVEIRGTLSNLSEILVHEGAEDKVREYWSVLRPYLEKEFMSEAEKTLGSPFTYTWEVCPSVHGDGHIIIILELQHIHRLD